MKDKYMAKIQAKDNAGFYRVIGIYCYYELALRACGRHADEIIKSYWKYWSEQVRLAVSRPNTLTKENCIEDWVTVNWATEVKTGELE